MDINWEPGRHQLYSIATVKILEADVKDYFYQTVDEKQTKITKIEFIRNEELQKRFLSQMTIMAHRGYDQKDNPHYRRFNSTPEKEAVLSRVRQLYELPVAQLKKEIKIIPAWIGLQECWAHLICHVGPADLRMRDKGFFGAGIYTTTQAAYAKKYSQGEIEWNGQNQWGSNPPPSVFTMVLCWVVVGNVYPICRAVDYPNKSHYSKFCDPSHSIGRALKARFDAHCACIAADKHLQAALWDNETGDFQKGQVLYDEIVVKEAAQILPYCVVYFKDNNTGEEFQ